MASAFLGNLMRPISQMVSPPYEPTTADPLEGPSSDRHINPKFGRSNPWLEASASSAIELVRQSSEASASSAIELVRQSSAHTSSAPAVAQLFSSLSSSSQALGITNAAFSQTAALLGVSEEQVLDKLKSLSDPTGPPIDSYAKYQALKAKIQGRIATSYEQRLEEASYKCRDAERKSSMLVEAARDEITGLQKRLSEERRANSDLLLALESLRSSGADTSVLKTFLAHKLPSFQREAYLDAKVCLLRKILVKYPDADMKYFLDMKEIPGSADPPTEWLAIPKGKFAYVSSLSAPPVGLNKKRRLQ